MTVNGFSINISIDHAEDVGLFFNWPSEFLPNDPKRLDDVTIEIGNGAFLSYNSMKDNFVDGDREKENAEIFKNENFDKDGFPKVPQNDSPRTINPSEPFAGGIEFLEFSLNFAAGVGASMLATYLYNILRKKKIRRVTIDRKTIEVNKTEITKIIEEKIHIEN